MTNFNDAPADVLSGRSRKQAAITVDLLNQELRTALRVRAAQVGLTYGALVRVLVSDHLDAVKGVSSAHDYPTRERERLLAHRRPGPAEPGEYPEGA